MPRVAKPTRDVGITDTIGHQETACEYRVETITGKTCMKRERQRECQKRVPVRGKTICSAGEKHNESLRKRNATSQGANYRLSVAHSLRVSRMWR